MIRWLALSIVSFFIFGAGITGEHAPATESPSGAPGMTTVVSGLGFRMAMPGDFLTDRAPVDLPWGKATENAYLAPNPSANITYVFGTFQWSRPQTKLDAAGLRKVRARFLSYHKCAAKDVGGERLLDADGKAWPQTVFEGVCAAGDSFRSAFILARGSLYHFQTIHQMAVDNPGSLPIDKALTKLVAGFSLVENNQ
jgi:hypothetical protein